MKQIIRNSTFETNSSSMHSIVISKFKENHTEDNIEYSFRFYQNYDEEGIINFDVEDILDFGRSPFQILYSYADKLRYYLASRYTTYKDNDYKEYLEYVKQKHTFIKDFKFLSKRYDFEENSYYYGYVDHQSYGVLEDFMKEHGLDYNNYDDVEKFLTSKEYVIIVDGDEYCIYDHFELSTLVYNDKNNTETLSDYVKEFILGLEKGERGYTEGDLLFIILNNNTSTYDKFELYNDVYLYNDGTFAIGSLPFEDYEPIDCIWSPIDKYLFCRLIYLGNKSKTTELNNLIYKYYPEAKHIDKIEDYKLINNQFKLQYKVIFEKFIKNEKISLEKFIFNKNYIIIVDAHNNRIFETLAYAGLLNHNIEAIIDLDTYR